MGLRRVLLSSSHQAREESCVILALASSPQILDPQSWFVHVR